MFSAWRFLQEVAFWANVVKKYLHRALFFRIALSWQHENKNSMIFNLHEMNLLLIRVVVSNALAARNAQVLDRLYDPQWWLQLWKKCFNFCPQFQFRWSTGYRAWRWFAVRSSRRDRYIGIKRLISTEQRTGGSPNTTGNLSDSELNRGGFPKYSWIKS